MPNLFDHSGGRPLPLDRVGYQPAFNDDGISVKGCNTIYAPRGQAGEYSALASNLYKGCGHGCAYCYVPLVTKQPRPEFDAGAAIRQPDILQRFARDAGRYAALGSQTQIMFSFTTDPYHPFDTQTTREALMILRDHGLPFCTLTKGGTRALRDLDLFRPELDAFASTLTSLDDKFSKKWERGAALPANRLAALRAFHERGIFTWVSLEPTLDADHSLALIEATHEFVDLYKVGRANYLKEITRTTDWEGYTHAMLDALTLRNKAHYIKLDLQGYLPRAYPNPLRVAQDKRPASVAALARLAQSQREAWEAV